MKFEEQLHQLKEADLLRELKVVEPTNAATCLYKGQELVNLASNDYLGLANDKLLKQAFYTQLNLHDEWLNFSASSSRLLTGNNAIYNEVEDLLCQNYKAEAALFFNSGYHANVGILPALAEKGDLILSDKLCHASIIDGIRLSQAEHLRFRHLDYDQLGTLLAKKRHNYQRVYIAVESVFSMDGDSADLAHLLKLKEQYDCMLYVDEAHAVGVLGDNGLGLCEQQQLTQQIDIIVGTLGKAYASVGAFAMVSYTLKQLLVNKARTLIYTTALPPINMAWSRFIIEQMPKLKGKRKQLGVLTDYMHSTLSQKGYQVHKSHIVPVMLGANTMAVQLAEHLQKEGFLVFPIRPPTVPVNTARLRISLCADTPMDALEKLMQFIPDYQN